MSAAVAVVIVVVVVAAIALVAFVASRIVSSQRAALLAPPPGFGPEYKHSPETVKYYGQTTSQPAENPKAFDTQTNNDPRQAPLPRCPSCGSATAYGDEKCRKCGLDLSTS